MPSEENVILPIWLNNELIEEILQKQDKNLKVVNVKIEEACGKGENFASKIMRIHVDVKIKKISEKKTFLLKFVNDGILGKFFCENGMFGREIEMYANTMPLIRELYDKYYPNDKIAPNTTYLEKDDNRMFIMEDLSLSGHKPGDRISGMDLEHCQLVLKKLGRFHAISALLVEQNPKVFDEYKKSIFFSKIFENFFSSLIRSLALEAENWPDQKHLIPKLQKLADNVQQIGQKALKHQPEEFLVLNHGDLWTANMLFKYTDSGNLLDAILVDYQAVFWGTPMIDLSYFLCSAVKGDYYENRDLLIKTYYDSLSETLKEIDYPKEVPTWDYMQQQVNEKEIIFAIYTCTCFPIHRAHVSDDFAFDERLYKNEFYRDKREKIFQRESTQAEMKRRLLQFEKVGLFDRL